MSKIIKMEGDMVAIGTEAGEIINVPLTALNYENPQINDEVTVYQSDDAIIVSRGDDGQAAYISGYQPLERTMNKHVFVWIGGFLFGYLGVDRFLRGQIGIGILKLITAGSFGIWWLIDFIIALVKAYGGSFPEEEITFIDGRYSR